jgi:hypothetical protein
VKRLLALAIALVALTACGSFGLRSHPISLAFESGDSYSYKLHAKLDYTVGAQGMTIPFKLELNAKDTVKVNSVDSSGVADVTINLTDITIKSTIKGTDETHVSKPETVNVKIASDGHIINVNGTDVTVGSLPDFTGLGNGLISAVLPTGDVKVGDTWKKTQDSKPPMGTGTIHVQTNNTYLRDEKVGAVDTAVVESKITSAIDITLDTGSLGLPMASARNRTSTSLAVQNVTMKGTLSSTVTSWIDTSGHRIVKTHSSGNTDGTLAVSMASPTSTPAAFQGPFSFKGTQSVEIDPA